jgi:hypothetical protein
LFPTTLSHKTMDEIEEEEEDDSDEVNKDNY